ncbi:LysR substrate-binding domain-containing protein [Trinickia dinghuensis]|uniref:LysR family transcriptional regulator n=1 Tax=Trinickia dinghuensis TaxID=2291023 RepID=A0A3D8JXV5_9BURK|nr:LysR substrate-binding domain-containing protein [Trinickia dinghuensis]RDU97455.1 LysR family transcriptional regulator [Trinickia dinghuensis]
MSVRLPSLQALFVFETCARALNFTRAAGELNVTPVAVSRMVSRLEDSLEIKLFARGKAGLALTDQGAFLLRAVSSGFGQITAAIEELKRQQAGKEVITLSLYSGFASLWLIPRFSEFLEAFPTVNLRLEVTSARQYGPLEGADLGVRLRDRASDRFLKCLCPEIILPVCSPAYLAEFGPIDSPSKTNHHTLLHVDPTTYTWADFYEGIGRTYPAHYRAVQHTDPGLAVQAAMLGQGVALGKLLAITSVLNTEQIVPASSHYVATGLDFVIEFRTQNPSRRAQEVSDWLIDAMHVELNKASPIFDSLTRVEHVEARARHAVP